MGFDDEDTSVSTLEWTTPSPPAYHTFEEIPAVKETQFSITKIMPIYIYT